MSGADDVTPPLRRATGAVLEIAVNVAAPAVLYRWSAAGLGDVRALILAALPPLLWSIVGFARTRRADAVALLALGGIVLSLLALFGGGSARLLQLREKLVTLFVALAFLGSVVIGRPLMAPLARAMMARGSVAELAEFDAKAHHPGVRRTLMTMSLVWGLGLLADVALSVLLIFTLTIAQYLIVGPLLLYATIGALSVWTALYRRRRQRAGPIGTDRRS